MDASEIAYTIAHKDDGNSWYAETDSTATTVTLTITANATFYDAAGVEIVEGEAYGDYAYVTVTNETFGDGEAYGVGYASDQLDNDGDLVNGASGTDISGIIELVVYTYTVENTEVSVSDGEFVYQNTTYTYDEASVTLPDEEDGTVEITAYSID